MLACAGGRSGGKGAFGVSVELGTKKKNGTERMPENLLPFILHGIFKRFKNGKVALALDFRIFFVFSPRAV